MEVNLEFLVIAAIVVLVLYYFYKQRETFATHMPITGTRAADMFELGMRGAMYSPN